MGFNSEFKGLKCPPKEPEIAHGNSKHRGKAHVRKYDFYFSVRLSEEQPTASDIIYSKTSNIVIYLFMCT